MAGAGLVLDGLDERQFLSKGDGDELEEWWGALFSPWFTLALGFAPLGAENTPDLLFRMTLTESRTFVLCPLRSVDLELLLDWGSMRVISGGLFPCAGFPFGDDDLAGCRITEVVASFLLDDALDWELELELELC